MSADKKSSPEQIIKEVYDVAGPAISVHDVTNIVPTSYDEIQYTYLGSSLDPVNITYKKDNVVIALLTFQYDPQGRLKRVSRQV